MRLSAGAEIQRLCGCTGSSATANRVKIRKHAKPGCVFFWFDNCLAAGIVEQLHGKACIAAKSGGKGMEVVKGVQSDGGLPTSDLEPKRDYWSLEGKWTQDTKYRTQNEEVEIEAESERCRNEGYI